MVMQSFARRKQGAYMVYVKMVNCHNRSSFYKFKFHVYQEKPSDPVLACEQALHFGDIVKSRRARGTHARGETRLARSNRKACSQANPVHYRGFVLSGGTFVQSPCACVFITRGDPQYTRFDYVSKHARFCDWAVRSTSERRSRYVTFPWQQNFWMTSNRKSHLKVYSHQFKLHRSFSISFNLANLGEIFFGTICNVI